MNLREFRECIEFNIENGIRHAVLGLGAPGVGKSQIIKQIGDKYGYKVIDLRLAQMSEVEIGGLIYPNEDRTKTRWLSPEVLPDEERDGPKTILLLDEITSCPKRVQVAAYQLILDRRVGQYKLPEGTFVIGLGNREDDDGVYIRLAGPLADRFEILYIDVDFKVWKNDYAIPYGIHSYVLNYLNFKPTALHTQSANEDSMIFATPRSWERVSDILKKNSDLTNPVVINKIAGNIGEAEAAQFAAFIGDESSLVTVDDYLAKKVAAYAGPIRLHVVNFTDIQLAIYDTCPHEELTVIMRRYMMRIAEHFANKDQDLAIITGESIGQVASQTMQSLITTNAVVSLPVYRPLVGFDKSEIVEIAKKIDTYETSILPYEDCCTIFVARHPVTKPVLEIIERSEAKLKGQIEELVETAIRTTETFTCK